MSAPRGGDGSVGPGEKPREALKITQTQGSSAGAGSGEFHVYRAARNAERERLAAMDRAAAEEEARLKFERERAIKNFHLEQEQKKKAEKRKHRKEKKQESVKKAKLDQPNELPKDGSFMEMFLKKQAELEKANADATREGSIIQDTIMTPEDAALGSKADAIAAAASAAPVAQSTDANAGSTMETAAATVSVSAVQNK